MPDLMKKIAGLLAPEKIDSVKKQEAPDALSEQEQISKLLDKEKKYVRSSDHHRRQWMTNIAFLAGKQHYSVSKKTGSSVEERVLWEFKNLERSKKTQRTVNRILPLYRSVLARALAMKSRVFVEAETQQDRDIAASKVGQEILEDHWQNVNKKNPYLAGKLSGMNAVTAKVLSYALAICEGYLKPYWNPETLGKAYAGDPAEVIESPIGQIETEVCHPFNLVFDKFRQCAFQFEPKSIDWIYNQYGVEVESEDIGLTEFERQLQSLMEGTSEEKYEDCAMLHQYYHLPSKGYPNGRFVVFTEKKILANDVLPPEYKNRLPFFDIGYLDIPLASFPQSMVEQLISLQEDYNFTVKRINDYKKWMTGKVIIEDGANLQAKFDDEVGQMVKKKAGAKVEYLNAPSIPQELFNDLNRIIRDMEDIAARHDVSMARAPKGVKSGVAIDSLAEADDSQLAPQLQHIEAQLSFYAEMVLDIAEEKYAEKRLITTAGKNLRPEIRTMLGEDAKGNKRVRVTLGSSMPAGKQARQTYILALKKEGILTPEKTAEMLELEDTEGLFFDIDRNAERQEIQDMLQGKFVQPMPFENHTIRLKVLADFMMGDEYKKLMDDPENQQGMEIAGQIYDHFTQHQEMLLQEQQVMASNTPSDKTGKKAGQPTEPQPSA